MLFLKFFLEPPLFFLFINVTMNTYTDEIQKSNPTPNGECKRCGACCSNGGPALHKEDLELLLNGTIRHDQLVTIRKGEFAFSPASNKIEPVREELIKICGSGKDWTCCFYDHKEKGCMIYTSRPLECRLLKCWDTAELLSAIYQDTIKRTDIINQGDPVRELIQEQEREIALDALEDLITAVTDNTDRTAALEKLTGLVRKDLALRTRALNDSALPEAYEFFIFGRPLFKQLEPFGITASEEDGKVHLCFQEK